MQSGELIVTGKDQVVIPLNGFPSQVVVDFKDECDVVPCNPHHNDQLEWEVSHSNTIPPQVILIINWDVTGVREIKWTAYY